MRLISKLFIIWMIVSLTKGGQAQTHGGFQFLIFQIIKFCTAEKSVHISMAVNLRSGPFLASPICSLMSSLAKIGPDQKSLKNSGRLADQTRDLIGC